MTVFGPVPNGTLNPRGLPLSPHFRDGRSLLRSSPQCRLGRSADRERMTAVKGALASTLLNTKMRNGTPYGLVELMDTRTQRPLLVRKTASAHEVFHLGQGIYEW